MAFHWPADDGRIQQYLDPLIDFKRKKKKKEKKRSQSLTFSEKTFWIRSCNSAVKCHGKCYNEVCCKRTALYLLFPNLSCTTMCSSISYVSFCFEYILHIIRQFVLIVLAVIDCPIRVIVLLSLE